MERKCGDGAKVRLCLANVPFVKIEEWSLDYKVTVGQQEVCLAQSLIVMFGISLVLLRGHQYNIDREEHSVLGMHKSTHRLRMPPAYRSPRKCKHCSYAERT